ncbi:Kynurenine formamidase [Anaerosporobacter mobilis DSM 15930]|jgi:arylformamidase|uniref:Kynurenine formamidase n=1 Tax=Anaerosporobacter mobilis DSM 15930 TaxID=1120996 RepID=A0A1M7LNA9_9FIRM|nr:cyclase family protein [Anaerosporobacter mobilis]SHM79732.1 Kynurenine formamidase [Anaerosporobacter mobilis DSM 15930]
MNVIDLTITVDNECLTCGTSWHQKPMLEKIGTINSVGRNTSRIVLGSHTGTHMDAPLHFYDNTHGIDKMDLNLLIGEIEIVDFTNLDRNTYVTLDMVKQINIKKRMLFIFGWYKYWKTEQYYNGFPYFDMEAANYLIENGMKLIALDTPSPDANNAIYEKNDSPVHKKLLQNNVVIIEYLTNTATIDINKQYEIVALPLKLKDIDGSPARVVLIER